MKTNQGTTPMDVTTMRKTIDRLLDPEPHQPPPAGDELTTLITTLRNHLEAITPAVEKAIHRLPKTDTERYCALACIGTTRQQLRITADGASHEVAVSLGRRLARSLNALLYHYEHLSPNQPEADQ